MIAPVVTSSGSFLIISNASALAFAMRASSQLVLRLGYAQMSEKASLFQAGLSSARVCLVSFVRRTK
jgi:hypothetical protein